MWLVRQVWWKILHLLCNVKSKRHILSFKPSAFPCSLHCKGVIGTAIFFKKIEKGKNIFPVIINMLLIELYWYWIQHMPLTEIRSCVGILCVLISFICSWPSWIFLFTLFPSVPVLKSALFYFRCSNQYVSLLGTSLGYFCQQKRMWWLSFLLIAAGNARYCWS